MLNEKPLKCLFVSMGLFGSEGSMVNERELARALSRNIKSLYVITFMPVNKYRRYSEDLRELKASLKHRLITLPNFIPPPINDLFSALNLFITCINSLALMVFAVMLKYAGLIDAIYVRDPRAAIAFFSPIKVASPISVKFGGFYTQDMERPNSIVGNFLVDFFERINRVVINKTDLLIIQNTLYKPFLKEFYGLTDSHPLLEVPAGISKLELPNNRSMSGNHAENPTPHYRIGYVGSISREAGSDILIDAMNIVQQTRLDVVLYIVIGGGDSVRINNIKQEAKRLGLNVVFSEAVAHKRALEIMQKLDVFVVPRRRTLSAELTIPIKVIEAFALGVPVIMTKHRVMEEKYKDEEDMLFVEPEPGDVAKKILRLLDDPHMAKRLAKNGLNNSKEFDYDVIASRLAAALYDSRRSGLSLSADI